jgi:hypothetical protein
MEASLAFKLPLRIWIKMAVVISIGWLIYAIPEALEYGVSYDAKLKAVGFAIAVGALILIFGMGCELTNNEIKKRINERRRRSY